MGSALSKRDMLRVCKAQAGRTVLSRVTDAQRVVAQLTTGLGSVPSAGLALLFDPFLACEDALGCDFL